MLSLQGRPCTSDEEQLKDLEERVNRKGLSAAEHEKFVEMKRKLQEEIDNKTFVRAKTQFCPSCKIAIEKTAG